MGATPTPDNEIAALRALLAERDAVLAERDVELRNAIFEIERLKVQLAIQRRDQYGNSSEKLAEEIGQLEMPIGDAEEDAAEAAAKVEAEARARSRLGQPCRPATNRQLPEHLPRRIIPHQPIFSCRCGDTDPKRLVKLGEDVTEMLDRILGRLEVIRYLRPRYACLACEAILQEPTPDLPVEKGRPGPGLLAHVLVSEYLDRLPLYRLSAILAREGVEIERQTLADWVGRGAWWLKRLAEAISVYALRHGLIWTAHTPIAVLAPGHCRTQEGRFWVYAIDPRPWQGQEPPAAFYRYSPDRKDKWQREHLQGFEGWMLADGYGSMARPRGSQTPQVIHVACWAHARRKFLEVFEATKSPIAEEALQRIAALYAIEAEINGQTAQLRLAPRQARSKPLLEELHDRMLAKRRRLSAKSTLGRAMQYALNRWEALARYLEDGRLSIDNHLAERQLGRIALTKKNFLFLGSDAGGDRAAIIYTVAETAKLNSLDPEAYIAAVLDRLARGHTTDRLEDILPWNIKLAGSP